MIHLSMQKTHKKSVSFKGFLCSGTHKVSLNKKSYRLKGVESRVTGHPP